MLRSLWRPLLLAVLLTGYLVALLPWQGFVDPDAFYHATLSHLLWQVGPVQDFAALDLTLVGQSFADLHFGFHVFVAPFTALFGPLPGLRIATLCLSLMFFATFYIILRRERISYAEWWVGLLALSAPFSFRLLLGKATPLALLLQLLGTWAVLRRRPWLAFLTGMGFALSHGGWPYLAGSAFLILMSEILYSRVVRTASWVSSFSLSPWREVGAVWAGVVVGLLLHPNRTNLLSFAWTQIVTIGLKTPLDQVALGKEWLPAAPGMVLASLAPWAILLLLAILGICLAPRKIFDEAHARGALCFAVITGALVALSFKSWRNVEYLVPTICLCLACLWQLIDIKKLLSLFCHSRENGNLSVRSSKIPTFVGMTIFFLLSAQATFAVWRGFHPSPFPDAMFQEVMGQISERAVPSDRVFHVWWDDFPMLFAADHRLRYVSGLDPTFLYVVNPVLSDELHELMRHPASSTQDAIWQMVHEKTHSRFLFLDLRRDGELLKIVEKDPRYAKVSENSEAVAWEVR